MSKYIPIALLLLLGCNSNPTDDPDAGPDGSTDSDTDTDTDDECLPWEPFDPSECPDMSGWSDCVVYVDADAGTDGDGKTWSSAFADLKDGLAIAACGAALTDICERWQVWAAEGTYYAHRGCDEDHFAFHSNVALYGGFAGNETELSERVPAAHVTILDGREGPEGEQHVWSVVVIGLAEGVILDGLTITGGATELEDLLDGGGIHLEYSTTSLTNCAVVGNRAAVGGGIYAWESTVDMDDCLFQDNHAHSGGGFYLIDAVATIDGCTFDSNAADYAVDDGGGGAIIGFDSSLQVENSDFLDNTSNYLAGSIYMNESEAQITSSSFAGNIAVTGGAIVNHLSHLTVESCTLENNTADGDAYEGPWGHGYGGAFYAENQGESTISGCTFSGNEASELGGAVCVTESSLIVIDSVFEENSSTGDDSQGGAVYQELGPMEISGSAFTNNSAGLQGGAIGTQFPDSITLEGSFFTGNVAGTCAGATALVGAGSTVVSGCLFAGNSSGQWGGAVGSGSNDEIAFDHCTFAGNHAVDGGSTIVMEEDPVQMIDCILWNTGVYEIYFDDETDPPIVTYSDVRGGWAGEGNIDADPLFVDPDGGDYCLQDGSPCIGVASDAGDMGYCPYEGK